MRSPLSDVTESKACLIKRPFKSINNLSSFTSRLNNANALVDITLTFSKGRHNANDKVDLTLRLRFV